MSLENYLSEYYPLDRQDVVEVEQALNHAVNVFVHEKTFTPEYAWPYEITAETKRSDKFSQNTTAMIVNTLLRYRGHFNATGLNAVSEYKNNTFAIDKALENCPATRVLNALDALLRNVLATSSLTTSSDTYGQNDIFTIAWLAELSHVNVNSGLQTAEGAVERAQQIAKLQTGVAEVVKVKAAAWIAKDKRALLAPNHAVPVEHSFPVLRLVQAATLTKAISDLTAFYDYFESQLHEQLSFSAIPDSRFDPAELVFCLEGMLLCQQNAVDRTVFDRVLEVLTLAQSKSAFWRPVKPFMSTAQGMVLFPVSVEIANSLMRCCVMVDSGKLHDTYGSKSVQLLRRYWQWLRARAVVSTNESNVTYLGWHSEHVNQATTIHLWETSQVMDFLMSYRNLLQHHIGRTTLVLSRVKVDEVAPEKWSDLEKRYEPVSTLGEALSVYKNIGRDFISERGSNADENYSMLLYGPPGTGKTTVAKSVASALDCRMITITVSDFLASGAAQVEARAKDIFTMLMAQPRCVVLFDEIDHFLLDRDSIRYAEQDTMFQFMTPGMLTKLADLRQLERVLFIVATNYEDRIDPAIKRTGRIDRKYIVLPPDARKRLEIIAELLTKYNVYSSSEFSAVDAEERQSLADSSLFLGYSDIKAVVQSFSKLQTKDLRQLSKIFEERSRTISLEAYQSRFVSNGENAPAVRETPMAEFLSLMALRAQLKQSPPVTGKKAMDYAADIIKASTDSDDVTAVEVQRCDLVGLGSDNHSKIANLFAAAK